DPCAPLSHFHSVAAEWEWATSSTGVHCSRTSSTRGAQCRGTRRRASHAKSTVLDRFSDVSLKRLKFFLRLAALLSALQHHQRYGNLAPCGFQRLCRRRPVHRGSMLQDA